MQPFAFALCAALLAANPGQSDRLAGLHGQDIYYPHTNFPKLTTPQWVGEEGVEAVVILAIDDMRNTAQYEAYLRPILQRLKQIDGRAPVSIMTCAVKPDDAQLQTWLDEGVSLEIHTFDHPCPLLQGTLADAKQTYDKCVDLLYAVPGNEPVAYRMPCCDSMNTVSPRFYQEIFNKRTPGGKFLHISSSVFQVYTGDDPEIPRELLLDADGKERFRKYFPKGLNYAGTTHNRFVNYVENYPYPYIIGNVCWEFPCMTPSDWEGNFLHQPNNPQTVADLQAALDITVVKQGVLNLVFHPHGWIKAEQVNELIDHAVAKHGSKVKFLTFKEALSRLNTNLLKGKSLRDEKGQDAGIRLVDVDRDGKVDVVNRADVKKLQLAGCRLPAESHPLTSVIITARDFDGDGHHELLLRGKFENLSPDNTGVAYGYRLSTQNLKTREWSLAKATIPESISTVSPDHFQAAARFVDLNEDGKLDLVFSDATQSGIWLFESLEQGWSHELFFRPRGQEPVENELPPIVRADGTNNGFFVRDRALHWMNEDTARLPNLLISRDFAAILGDRLPMAKTPTAAKDSMRPRPGFTVELMAHEPLVRDPVAFQWGADGKLWVVEMADYPNGLDGKGQPGGRVRFLEDTDGDGHYDKSTLFLEDVPFPSGVHPWKNGVLISAAPDIFFAADTNGDGKADTREILYTGFVEGNQQHRVNGFTWGLDGWLYVGNGDSGGTITSTKTGKTVEIRNRDLRIKPDTGELEAISGQTQFGRSRDDFHHWFGNNNSRPLWQYVLEEQALSRNPHLAPPESRIDVSEQPGNAPIHPASKTMARFNDFHTANRFTSACSAMIYRDDLFAPLFAGQDAGEEPVFSFVSEPVHNLVHAEVVRTDGNRFTSRRLRDEQSSEFLASTDNWFRPTQLRTGPDGALWIADMYRLVIEHPQWIPVEWQERLNVRAGDDQGRLWRIFPKGAALRPIPRLDQLSNAELVLSLESASGWQRDTMHQLLLERLAGAADQSDRQACCVALREMAQKSVRPAVRVQALWLLDQLGGTTGELLRTALRDSHPGVKVAAIRLAEQTAKTDDRLLRDLCDLAKGAHPWVQLQLAATLGELPGDLPSDAMASLWQTTDDADVRVMLLSSLNETNLPAQLQALHRTADFAQQGHPALLSLLTYAVATNHRATLEDLGDVLLVTPPAEAQPWQLAAIETWLQVQQRSSVSWKKWLEQTRTNTPELAQQWQNWSTRIRPLIDDPQVDASRRAAALWAFSRVNDQLAFSEDWLKATQPPEVQQAALSVLNRLPDGEASELLIRHWSKFSPRLRAVAREHLLGQTAIAKAFLEGLQAGTLTAPEIDPETDQFLRTHRDAQIREAVAQILPDHSETSRSELVARYLRDMPEAGETTMGAELFGKRCAQCHRLNNLGHAVGPDLGALTDKSLSALVTAVLDPNRAVEAKYLQYGAETSSGQVHTGLLSQETATSLTLLGAEAKATSLLRQELEDLWSVQKSLMPEGLEKEISPADMAHLMAFVRGNVALPVRKEIAGNQPQRISADAAGTFLLTPATCEIYGPTITFEPQHQNLGWWSSADDFVTWTLEVPKTGRYEVELEWACDRQAAGHRVIVTSRDSRVLHQVAATDGWNDYRSQKIGEIVLQAGIQSLTVKPASRPLPALMDMKGMKLIPLPSTSVSP